MWLEMKRQLSLIIVILCSISLFADATKSLEFYRSIPKYESISLSVKDFKFQIKPNYTVNITGEYSSSENKATLQGSGVVSWDASNNRMVINANFTISGTHSSSEDKYTYETVYNKGSVANNTLAILFGGELESHTKTERRFDHTEYYHAKGSKSYSETWPLYINSDGTYYIGSNSSYSVTMTGDVTRSVSFGLDTNDRNVSYGSARSGNNSTVDEFGQWKWDKEKTKLWLNAANIDNTKLYIWTNKGTSKPMELSLYFDGHTIEGKSSSTTEDGRKLIQITISFEDGTIVTLPFVERLQNNGYYIYDYATYNRFLESWDYGAASIIEQIKNKQTIMVTYKYQNSNYTAIFELEGLEAILSYF